MPVFLPAAVHSHQTNCVEALLRLQAIINETLEQWRRSAEPPRKQAAALRDVVRAARVTLPGDFKPSSEVAADAYAKLGARGLSEPPKLQKDVDAFSELCEEAKGLCDAVCEEANELAHEMDEGPTDVGFDTSALISLLAVSHTARTHAFDPPYP